MRRLTIISHTEHYRTPEGEIVGLGSTVTEINHLLLLFDEITHVAMLHDQNPPPSALPYVSNRITFVAIPVVGGQKLNDKLFIVLKAPKILSVVNRYLNDSDWFQFRAPTGIGVFLIPYLIFFRRKDKGWYKYAGNWKQQKAPIGYRFQKWLLLKQSRKVTINGSWENQPKQSISFENPCLTKEDLRRGKGIRGAKSFDTPLELCFVGRLEEEKGLDLIIDALHGLSLESAKKIGTVHIVGSGSRKKAFERKTASQHINFQFYGMLSRIKVQDIYTQSHAIILPSKSEGFPKVISEALNFGCLPIVSDVSSISQYIIDGENGYVIKALTLQGLKETIERFLRLNTEVYKQMIIQPTDFIERFSYEYYNYRLTKTILEK